MEWFKGLTRVRQVAVVVAGTLVLLFVIGALTAGEDSANAGNEASGNNAKIASLKSNLADTEEELAATEDELAATEDELAAAETQLANSQDEADTLEAKLSDSQDKIAEYEEAQEQAAPNDNAQDAVQRQPAGTGTKHVRVVVTSDTPVDVSIMDDYFEVNIAEEVMGQQTYEFDIARDSGLWATAMTMKMRGNVSMSIYEDGKLVAEDTDNTGMVDISY